MAWYEKLGFIEDPYTKRDPFTIPSERLAWNRPDLSEAKTKLDSFLRDMEQDYRVGLKVFGPHGSGKTWLLKLIEKLVSSKKENSLVLYTKIPYLESKFQRLYSIFITDLDSRNGLEKIVDGISEKTGRTVNDWARFLRDRDLAQCLHNIKHGSQEQVSRGWLYGEAMSLSDLRRANIYVRLDSDYSMFRVMQTLLENSSLAFSSAVLSIDEMENADAALARGLSDALRDLLDAFSEKFGLVCSYTAQREDEWFDFGYREALGRRLDYVIELGQLQKDAIVEFVSIHHSLYRKKDSGVTNGLQPFSEEGLLRLYDVMEIGYLYPGYFLPNCGVLARIAAEKKLEVTADLVNSSLSHLRWLKSSSS